MFTLVAKFDVVVVGGGTAGCLAAKTTAEKGLSVCLVETKRKEEIGEKVCGDALGEHHLKTVGLEKPQGGEFEKRIDGIRIFSPDLETVFTVKSEDFMGYVLNRRLFGQWLLKKALDNGASLMDSVKCIAPKFEKGYVTGISARNVKTGGSFDLDAKVVVDASGFSGVIRHKLPEEMGIDVEIEKEDVEACYREIRQLNRESQDTEFCNIYLSQKVSPAGYAWIFPKGGTKVNVGLGICMRGRFPNPKQQLYTHVLGKPLFQGSLLLNGGAWYDPTRRPLDNMVGDGVAIVGDAASLVNPIHGGGIGPSMLSGYLAGGAIVEGLENGDVSKKSLWSYNKKYMEAYGAKQAGLDVFRRLLIKLDDADLSYGMKYQLLTEEDVLKAGIGDEFHLKITQTATRVFKGLRKIGFLNRLRLTVDMMRHVKEHYRIYPTTPEEFDAWKGKTLALFENVKSKLEK
jgi:digeranylgeranylglycerophospholipid reductase